MKTGAFYQADVNEADIAAFILKNHHPYRDWGAPALLYWIAFHQHQQFLIATSDDGLTISGLVIARPIMEAMDAFEHYTFDNEGPIVYVDLCVATKPEVLRGLVVALVHRFGLRRSVAWHRRSGRKLVVRPAARVIARVLKKSNVLA